MAIQYGYISLFSPSFPLAPLLAFINNLTEIRGDAWKLCKGFQRPQGAQAEDIGSWFAVLNLLGFVAVLTNATMIAFVGSQLAEPGNVSKPINLSTNRQPQMCSTPLHGSLQQNTTTAFPSALTVWFFDLAVSDAIDLSSHACTHARTTGFREAEHHQPGAGCANVDLRGDCGAQCDAVSCLHPRLLPGLPGVDRRREGRSALPRRGDEKTLARPARAGAGALPRYATPPHQLACSSW